MVKKLIEVTKVKSNATKEIIKKMSNEASNKIINEVINELSNEISKESKVEVLEKENKSKKLVSNESKKSNDSTIKERIMWALTKPSKIERKENMSIRQQKIIQQKEEKEWGNKMINKTDCKQWTTLLGENLVKDVLIMNGENPRKPETKNNFRPDWETDDYIYEVKTSSWEVDGTAGEKVLGTWIKYQDIPILYKKPLRIVCVAYQEWELTNGKTNYFGEKVSEKTKQVLELCKSWNIEYIKFSDLVKNIDINGL
jgi:hypothetical protein